MNIIITSEMRVGSRWLHYLLADLLHMGVSPELDVRFLQSKSCMVEIQQRFLDKKIVKFHHATPIQITSTIKGEYKVIGIVRNPNDRVTSFTFHQRYKPPGKGHLPIKNAPSDKEAVKVAFNDKGVKEANERQFELMPACSSTRQYTGAPTQKYMWTCYHWLINDTFNEIKKICEFLGARVTDTEIRRACIKHSFKHKSGREPGNEKRNDDWRRKGVEGDHLNFFDEEMLQENFEIQRKFWFLVKNEEDD